MKITNVELFKVKPRWLFLKIDTDEGISGWGEPIVEGRADTVLACVEEMKSYLLGQDPCKIEDLWQTMYRGGFYRGGPVMTSALSGIDQALWDIKGKYHNMPAYDLMGGACRDKILVYGRAGGSNYDEAVISVKKAMDKGYKAVKTAYEIKYGFLDSFDKIQRMSDMVAGLRAGGGNELIIGIDLHGRVHRTSAKQICYELDKHNLSFIEEPVLSENNDALLEIARYTKTPIATGERIYTRWGFKELFKLGVVDIIQPDVSHAGGIWETRKIAAMAEAYDVVVAPHCPLGPIAFASCLQIDACTPNSVIQEQAIDVHYSENNPALEYLVDKTVFNFKDGYVDIPKKPGLGIEIDEAKVREAAKEGHSWKNPLWRMEDGTVTEW